MNTDGWRRLQLSDFETALWNGRFSFTAAEKSKQRKSGVLLSHSFPWCKKEHALDAWMNGRNGGTQDAQTLHLYLELLNF